MQYILKHKHVETGETPKKTKQELSDWIALGLMFPKSQYKVQELDDNMQTIAEYDLCNYSLPCPTSKIKPFNEKSKG